MIGKKNQQQTYKIQTQQTAEKLFKIINETINQQLQNLVKEEADQYFRSSNYSGLSDSQNKRQNQISQQENEQKYSFSRLEETKMHTEQNKLLMFQNSSITFCDSNQKSKYLINNNQILSFDIDNLYKNRGNSNLILQQQFAGYLGFESKSWAAILQTLFFGFLTFGISIGLAFIFKAGTNLSLNKSLIISTAICSLLIGILFYNLHGQYQLQREGRYILGELRSERMQNKLIGFCLAFVFVMSVPTIGTLLVQNSQYDSSTLLGFVVAFIVQIILAICGHLITNFHENNQQTTSFSGSPYLDQSSVNQNQAASNFNPHFQKKIVKPVTAIFRDLFKPFLNVMQTLIIISITFIPLLIGFNAANHVSSIQNQNYYNTATSNLSKGLFKFRHVIKQGFLKQNYWQIQSQNNTLSKYFTNGELVTQQKIKQLLNADKYYTNVIFPNQSIQVQYADSNVWQLLNGTIIKLYQNTNGSYNKLVRISQNNIQKQIAMSLTTNQTYINGYKLQNPSLFDKYIYYNVSIILQYINNTAILYQMQKTIQLVNWRTFDTSNYGANIIQFIWWKHSQYRGGYSINFIINNTQGVQYRKLQYTAVYGVWPKSIISAYQIVNFTQKYIDFQNGVFDQSNNLYMYNYKSINLPNLTYKTINPYNNYKYIWNTNNFFDNNNQMINLYIVQQFIDTDNRSTIVKLNKTNNTHNNKIIATLTHDYDSNKIHSNHYFQWVIQAKLYNIQTIKNYQYIYYPIKYINFWIAIYFICIIVSICISMIFHCIFKKCILYPKLYIDTNCIIKQQNHLCQNSLFHFIYILFIYIFGGIPLYLTVLQQYTNISNILFVNIIFSYILTAAIYYFTLKSWNQHSFRNQWMSDLQIIPDNYYRILINKSLREIGIAYNQQLIQMLYKYGYKIYFLNSYRVRELLRQHTNVKALQNQLSQFVSVQNINLNLPLNKQTVVPQTFCLAFPLFVVNMLFLIYALLASINKISINMLNIKVFIGIQVAIGISSIVNFVWKHRNQVFQKDNQKKVTRRPTTYCDLIKITIIAFFMMGLILGSLITSLVIANNIGANISLQFLISLICGGMIGFILAVVLHSIWNRVSGVMAIIQ